jgi:hypothetical protein
MVAAPFALNILIGGTPVRVVSRDELFAQMLAREYAGFIGTETSEAIELEVTLTGAPFSVSADDDLTVRREGGAWIMQRGDFYARYDPVLRSCAIRQSANRHSIDSVIRIVHTLALAPGHGFLLHAASAIRAGSSFIFAGPSGAGKTTMASLAPRDANLLSDEVSCIRKCDAGFIAAGTPFTGELGRSGENISAPVKALFFLRHATENRITRLPDAEAVRMLMRNILFFAGDASLVARVFDLACEFISSVPAFRLSFLPDSRVWDLIR